MGSGCCSGGSKDGNTASCGSPSSPVSAISTGCCATTNIDSTTDAVNSSPLTSEAKATAEDGCCKKGDDPCNKSEELSSNEEAVRSCKDACCDIEPKSIACDDAAQVSCCSDTQDASTENKTASPCGDGCCDEKPVTNTCGSQKKLAAGCCGIKPESVAPGAATQYSCCTDTQNASTDDKSAASCGDGCCDEKPTANTCGSQGQLSAGCCDNKQNTCSKDSRSPSISSDATTCCGSEERCNEKCILAVAAMECEKACDEDFKHNEAEGHHHAHDKDGHHLESACTTHLQSAMSRYEAYIEQARCICRSILNSGLTKTSCCAARKASDPRSSKKKSKSHGPLAPNTGKPRETSSDATKNRLDRSFDDSLAITPAGISKSGCCAAKTAGPLPPKVSPPEIFKVREKQKDPEEGSGIEVVTVSVNGMTCSGCGDKLSRILEATPGVSEVRVNFVMSNADFSVDLSSTKAEDVIRSAEGSTGFHLARLAGGDYYLDVVASGLAVRGLADAAIKGVTNVMVLDKRTVRISYEPTVVGARDLFDEIHDRTDGLAPPRSDPSLANGRKRLYDQLIKTCLAAILTIPVVVLAWGDKLVDDKTRAYVSIVLATFVQLIAVPEFYQPALSALFRDHVLEMDMLVVISITAAYIYSIVAFGFRMANQPLETKEFFETSTLLITLILLGRLVATYARVKAVSAVSMRSLQSSNAVLVEEGKDREIDARLLQYGDTFKILPHTRVVTDGFVLSGCSEVDESMLTGEPIPVLKQSGDYVIAGTVNGDGTIMAQLTRLPGKNTVTDIAQMVEEATNSKPKIQDLANKVASWFVPVVSAIAAIVVVVWVVVGLRVRNENTGKAVADAITYAVAVLAVSCPCALGLAVPMVLVIAGGIAARGGIIIKSADCTERARKCTDVIFDKTGTITEGDLDVVAEEYLGANDEEAMAIAKSLVTGGKHPVSAAAERHLDSRAVKPLVGTCDLRVIPGAGVEATFKGSVLRAGNSRWTGADTLPAVARLQDQGLTTLVVTRNSTPLVVFGLRTQLRPEAERVISALKARNITVHLVSGDQARAVRSVAEAVGIPADKVAAEKTPSEKRDYVAAVMEDPRRYVMFCGDGTNDAVAVAQAHVGAQMGGALSSSDVTQGAADVILLAGLDGIPFLLDVSKASFHRMVFNFAWSAVYNVLAILLAGGAFVRVRIEPAYAGLGEIVSVLPVILAALSMLLLNIRGKSQQ